MVFLKEVESTAIHRFVARVMMVILTALLLSLEMTTSVKVLQHSVHGGALPASTLTTYSGMVKAVDQSTDAVNSTVHRGSQRSCPIQHQITLNYASACIMLRRSLI